MILDSKMDDIPNWTSLIVEIGVAVFAITMSILFYTREKNRREISDEIITQQGEKLDELNKSNVKQQEMIKSMSEIIDAQQKEIKDKELKKVRDIQYNIEQFILFLKSIDELGKEFLKCNGSFGIQCVELLSV